MNIGTPPAGPSRGRRRLVAWLLAGGLPRLGAVRLAATSAAAMAAADVAHAQPAAAPGHGGVAFVVWDFDNQTPPGASAHRPEQIDYLRRSLAEAITQALLEAGSVPVVERQRLRDVLAEQRLGTSDLADADTRLRLGRIVGAGRMVFGGYFALGDQVQVNLRVVETATSRVLLSDEFAAPLEQVMARAQPLALRLARHFGGDGAGAAGGYPPQAWLAYDRALALSDDGQYEQAISALQRLLAEQKDFQPAERQLVALLDKMRRR
jgi:tetratricopeptide (TPR) repeat protein